MRPEKKPYSKPELIVHGSLEKITHQSGSSFVDVPFGTPVGVPGGITGS